VGKNTIRKTGSSLNPDCLNALIVIFKNTSSSQEKEIALQRILKLEQQSDI
jgi:hypothetical protein